MQHVGVCARRIAEPLLRAAAPSPNERRVWVESDRGIEILLGVLVIVQRVVLHAAPGEGVVARRIVLDRLIVIGDRLGRFAFIGIAVAAVGIGLRQDFFGLRLPA